MLMFVLVRMRAKRLAIVWVQGVEVQSIQLVIAHDRLRLARTDQFLNGLEHGAAIWPAAAGSRH